MTDMPQLGDERIIEISAPFGYTIGRETRKGLVLKVRQVYEENSNFKTPLDIRHWKDVEFVD